MKNQKTCLDCLYCKVSARSTSNCRLCFCSETRAKERHKEQYWLEKKPCGKFDDMAGKPTTVILFPTNRRRSLLSARTNNERYGYRFL
jgi:hypothetical protein